MESVELVHYSFRDENNLLLKMSADLDECNSTGEVRLVNGSSPEDGVVEVCYDGEYRVICDTFWDELDATVVCRQLGYSIGGNTNK